MGGQNRDNLSMSVPFLIAMVLQCLSSENGPDWRELKFKTFLRKHPGFSVTPLFLHFQKLSFCSLWHFTNPHTKLKKKKIMEISWHSASFAKMLPSCSRETMTAGYQLTSRNVEVNGSGLLPKDHQYSGPLQRRHIPCFVRVHPAHTDTGRGHPQRL